MVISGLLRVRAVRATAISLLFLGHVAAAGRHPNVILISLDQCRADELHLYGNPRETSPNLDRMGREGVCFTHFYSAAPWTAPSYSSIMTSQYPSRHGVTINIPRGEEAHRPDAVMLAELFKKAGYSTAAFINNSVAGRRITGKGFDEYDEAQMRAVSITERWSLSNPEFHAPAVTERVKAWLGKDHPQPFFLFVLYFEPHSPYNAAPEDDLFKSDAYPEMTNTGYDAVGGRLFRLANIGDRKAVERLRQLYDGKIHFVDRYVGELLKTLRSSGMDQDTIVLLLSDHGEMLYTHPEDYNTFDHVSLYDPVMHIPAILWGRGVPHGKRIGALATHIDVAPTLLQLAGLPPKADAQGESLVPLIEERRQSVHSYVFGEQDVLEPLRSVRDERYKLILNERTGARQLFDIQTDPAEKQNLASRDTRILERLSAPLTRWRAENEPPANKLRERWQKWMAAGPAAYTVDEVTTGAHMQLNGSGWQMADDPSCYKEACYWSEPTGKGEAPKTAIWREENPMLGNYRILFWYGRLPQGGVATDVPFTITTRDGHRTSLHIDQTKNTGAWHEIGLYRDPLEVALSTAANGRVVVDAVKFERVQ